MVEEDAAAGRHAERCTIAFGGEMGVELGDGVRISRGEGSVFVERWHPVLAQDLAARGLEETGFLADRTNGLEEAHNTHRVDLGSGDRFLERERDGALGGKIIHLVWPDLSNAAQEAGEVEQLARDEMKVFFDAERSQASQVQRHAFSVAAENRVAFFEQEFRQIRTILAGDTGDQGRSVLHRDVFMG